MSSTNTEYEFTSSLEKDSNVYLTKDKQFNYFSDLQGGNYNNNSSEVKFELISLANTNQFVNWSESFIMIPLQLSVGGYVAGTGVGGLAGTPENAFALSLKNGYQHIIDSLLITVNDNPINQPCQGANIEQTFRLYQMSADDRRVLGDSMNFYLDDGTSIRHIAAAAALQAPGNVPLTTIDAAGLASFNADITPLKGQQFVFNGTTYTVLSIVTARTINVTPAIIVAAGAGGNVTFSTPASVTNAGLGETNNVIAKSSSFNPKDGFGAINGVVKSGRYNQF